MFPSRPRLQLRINAAYDEHVTTFWVLFDGHYHALFAALLALPSHSYDPDARVWVVDAAGLLLLREGGWQVVPGFLDDVRAARAHRLTRAYLRRLLRRA